MERHKPKSFEVVVAQVVPETPDTVTLTLRAEEPPPYSAGQFLTISPGQFKACRAHQLFLEHLKGRREQPRAYSVSSAPHEPELAITIKEEAFDPVTARHAPLLSPLLVYATPPGTRFSAVGFTGPYVLAPDVEARTDHLLHVVAGSGAVPNFSILKDSLHRHATLRHTFLSSNKTWDDVCFREQLLALAAAHPGRLRVVNTLTRETDPGRTRGDCRQGRVTLELITELLPDAGTAFAYVCGPAITSWERRAALEQRVSPTPRFLESTLGFLQTLGVSHDRIKREAYG